MQLFTQKTIYGEVGVIMIPRLSPSLTMAESGDDLLIIQSIPSRPRLNPTTQLFLPWGGNHRRSPKRFLRGDTEECEIFQGKS